MWCCGATLKYPSGALRAPFVRTVLSPLTGEMPRKGQRGNYGAVTSFRRTSGVAGNQSLPCVKGGGVRKDDGGIDAEQ